MPPRYNKYFQSMLNGRQRQPNDIPSLGQSAPLDNYLSSESVLGNPDAQNSAQKADNASSNMAQAYDSVKSFLGSPEGMKLQQRTAAGMADQDPNAVFDLNGKNASAEMLKSQVAAQEEADKKISAQNSLSKIDQQLKDIYSDKQYASDPSKMNQIAQLKDDQYIAGRMSGYSPSGKTVFAGGYKEVLPSGKLRDEMSDIAYKMNNENFAGFAKMGGGKGKMTSGMQTNTSNVAKFGETPRVATDFETSLAMIRGQKGETMGNSDDRARWEAQAYRAKAESEAKAAKDLENAKKGMK